MLVYQRVQIYLGPAGNEAPKKSPVRAASNASALGSASGSDIVPVEVALGSEPASGSGAQRIGHINALGAQLVVFVDGLPNWKMGGCSMIFHGYVKVYRNISGWWLEHGWIMTFHVLGTILPFDELIFFRGVGQPPTSRGFEIVFFFQFTIVKSLGVYDGLWWFRWLILLMLHPTILCIPWNVR